MRRHRSISQRRTGSLHGGRRRAGDVSRGGLRAWVYVALFTTSAVLFALDITHHRIARDARQLMTDMAAPVLGLASGTVLVAGRWFDEARDFVRAYDEIDRLRAENRELRQWKRRARELEGRTRRFEALLNLEPDPDAHVITARAIADARSRFARTMIINAGSESGVREGNAVLGTEGLVGRVISAGAHSARVLLVSDLESRIPVYVGTGRHRSILSGTNGPEPTLMFLPAGAALTDGDIVVTSGEARLLPPNLPVGEVHLGGDGEVSVALASDPVATEFVRVLDYKVAIDVADGEPPLPLAITGSTGVASADPVDGSAVVRAAVGPQTPPGAP